MTRWAETNWKRIENEDLLINTLFESLKFAYSAVCCGNTYAPPAHPPHPHPYYENYYENVSLKFLIFLCSINQQKLLFFVW